jgi:hypothetical protein
MDYAMSAINKALSGAKDFIVKTSGRSIRTLGKTVAEGKHSHTSQRFCMTSLMLNAHIRLALTHYLVTGLKDSFTKKQELADDLKEKNGNYLKYGRGYFQVQDGKLVRQHAACKEATKKAFENYEAKKKLEDKAEQAINDNKEKFDAAEAEYVANETVSQWCAVACIIQELYLSPILFYPYWYF